MAHHENLSVEERSAELEPNKQGLNLLHVALRQKWLILMCLIIGGGLGYLYYNEAVPMYESTAQINVTSKNDVDTSVFARNRRDGDEGSAQGMMESQILIIRSPRIVQSAIDAGNLASLKTFASRPGQEKRTDPVQVIINGLDVQLARTGATILDLSFVGPHRHESQKILDAILDAYERDLDGKEEGYSENTGELLTAARDSLDKDYKKAKAEYAKFLNDSPLRLRTDKDGIRRGINQHEAEADKFKELLSKESDEYRRIAANLKSIENAQKKKRRLGVILVLIEAQTKTASDLDSGSGGKDKQGIMLNRLLPLLEEQALLDNLGPEHPKVIEIKKKINLTKKFLADLGANLTGNTAADFVDIYMEALQEELITSEEKKKGFAKLFEDEQAAAKELGTYQLEEMRLWDNVDLKKQLFDVVLKRLEEHSLVKDRHETRGGYNVSRLKSATDGKKVAPVLLKIVGVGGILGILLGLGLGLLIELSDQRFGSPEEISKYLQTPIIGQLLELPRKKQSVNSASTQMDSSLCTYHRPKSREAEAIRSIRTALFFSVRGEGHKIIQVTSPNKGDGKTTLAANLAMSIANTGKSVLLLDADFRRPRVHKMFGLKNQIGMSTVILGKAEIQDCIQETEAENLFVLPCGARPDNPSELLTMPRFEELLNVLREKYDFVIIDSPPLLAVTDPCIIAARVDGVLLAMRPQRRSRVESGQSMELLNSIGANIMGLVLNGHDTSNGGGFKSGYGYGGYGYGYNGYGGYGYGNYSNSAYYTDESSSNHQKKESVDQPTDQAPSNHSA